MRPCASVARCSFHVLGAQLSETARRLDRIGAEWDRRLHAITQITEDR